MKSLLLSVTLLMSTAYSAETLILEVPASEMGTNFDFVESKMFVDVKSGEAKAIMSSMKEYESCTWTSSGQWDIPSYDCTSYYSVVKNVEAPLVDIRLEDREIIFTGASEALSCGVIKNGRIFKNATRLILNGKCNIRHRLINKNGLPTYELLLITK